MLGLFALACAAALGGCGSLNPLAASRQTNVAAWTAATGLARSNDAAAAATAAIEQARDRLGGGRVAAVLFFECFPEPADGVIVARTIQAACTQAEVAGCSAGGVATADGQAADRAVAVLAIAGGVRASSAYAPPSFASGRAAGQWLAEQLGGQDMPGSATIVLAVPATLAAANWDATALIGGLAGDKPGAMIAGGLAGGSRPLVYHAGRAFAGGVVALAVGSATTDAAAGSSQQLLPLGPAWRASRVNGQVIMQLSDGRVTMSAEGAITRAGLLAQDRPEACLGRLDDGCTIPLRFSSTADGGLLMPVPVKEGERFVLLRPAGPRAAELAIGQALDLAALPAPRTGSGAAGPAILLAAPDGRDRLTVLPLLHARLAGRAGAIAFLCPGQFVPLPGGTRFASHLFAALQIAPR